MVQHCSLWLIVIGEILPSDCLPDIVFLQERGVWTGSRNQPRKIEQDYVLAVERMSTWCRAADKEKVEGGPRL